MSDQRRSKHHLDTYEVEASLTKKKEASTRTHKSSSYEEGTLKAFIA